MATVIETKPFRAVLIPTDGEIEVLEHVTEQDVERILSGSADVVCAFKRSTPARLKCVVLVDSIGHVRLTGPRPFNERATAFLKKHEKKRYPAGDLVGPAIVCGYSYRQDSQRWSDIPWEFEHELTDPDVE